MPEDVVFELTWLQRAARERALLSRIASPEAAAELAAHLLDPARTRPVVVISIPAGYAVPFIDPTAVAHALGALAEVCGVPTNEITWSLSRTLPELTQVYGGAGRSTRPDSTNLLDNAMRHTSCGGRVELMVDRVGTSVRLVVSDDGEGIPAEHLPHVFDRFYRVDTARDRAHGGSGVGLAIARVITEAHEGTIIAQSPGRGHGAVFTVILPAVRDGAAG